jgi:hypothetical protein
MTNIEKYYNEQIRSFAGLPFHQLRAKEVHYLKTSSGFLFWKWNKVMLRIKQAIKRRFSF